MRDMNIAINIKGKPMVAMIRQEIKDMKFIFLERNQDYFKSLDNQMVITVYLSEFTRNYFHEKFGKSSIFNPIKEQLGLHEEDCVLLKNDVADYVLRVKCALKERHDDKFDSLRYPFTYRCGMPESDRRHFATFSLQIVAGIKDVIFNPPATIVLWNDGTKTVVKCNDKDTYDKEKGLAMAFMKKQLGNKGQYYKEMKRWTERTDIHENSNGKDA